jgi:hypothetical protein
MFLLVVHVVYGSVKSIVSCCDNFHTFNLKLGLGKDSVRKVLRLTCWARFSEIIKKNSHSMIVLFNIEKISVICFLKKMVWTPSSYMYIYFFVISCFDWVNLAYYKFTSICFFFLICSQEHYWYLESIPVAEYMQWN